MNFPRRGGRGRGRGKGRERGRERGRGRELEWWFGDWLGREEEGEDEEGLHYYLVL